MKRVGPAHIISPIAGLSGWYVIAFREKSRNTVFFVEKKTLLVNTVRKNKHHSLTMATGSLNSDFQIVSM